MARKKTSDALEILHQRYYQDNPQRLASLEAQRQNAAISRKLYALRKRAGLTQQQVANLAGTPVSEISRIEATDFDRLSLTTLRRVAALLNANVEVGIEPRVSTG